MAKVAHKALTRLVALRKRRCEQARQELRAAEQLLRDMEKGILRERQRLEQRAREIFTKTNEAYAEVIGQEVARVEIEDLRYRVATWKAELAAERLELEKMIARKEEQKEKVAGASRRYRQRQRKLQALEELAGSYARKRQQQERREEDFLLDELASRSRDAPVHDEF